MICVGIDVAKDTHWACALDAGGRVLFSRAVRNTQAELDALSAELRALPGPVQVGLDVNGSIATFLQALLLADGIALVHVPGLAVNRAAHGYAGGERKSDPQDAQVIVDLVRTRDGLRPIRPDDDATASPRLLVSRRRDLVQDQGRRVSRLRQRLSQTHPSLEAKLDVTCKGPLALLTCYVTPAEIGKASVRHLRRTSSASSTRAPSAPSASIPTAEPTTTANGARGSITSRPSSPSHDSAATSCGPCSPMINPTIPTIAPLDNRITQPQYGP